MEKTMMENNTVALTGEVVSEKEFSHEVFGEGFYIIKLEVARLSGNIDTIPITISDRMPNFGYIEVGSFISVDGQYRSFNKHDTKPKLMLSVFAREIIILDEPGNTNDVDLRGYICKGPVFRVTPLKREVCDLLIAVNRPYGKSDYIPCITWGRNAMYTNELTIGDEISVHGRIQSREYKKIWEGSEEIRIAYEVSVSRIERGH